MFADAMTEEVALGKTKDRKWLTIFGFNTRGVIVKSSECNIIYKRTINYHLFWGEGVLPLPLPFICLPKMYDMMRSRNVVSVENMIDLKSTQGSLWDTI